MKDHDIELTKEDLVNSDGIYHSYFKRMVERFKNNINDEKYTRSIIANFSVYFSHYTIHKIASKLNFDNYLILEDDCLLRRQWQNILHNAIDSKIDKFDIIRSYRRNRFFKFDNCTWQSKYANDKSHNMSAFPTQYSLMESLLRKLLITLIVILCIILMQYTIPIFLIVIVYILANKKVHWEVIFLILFNSYDSTQKKLSYSVFY